MFRLFLIKYFGDFMTNNDENRTLNLPYDTKLPFFAYGIFKPGQIAYSKIRNHVNNHSDNIEINYAMRQRDGVPILIDNENNHSHTEGSILTFKEGHEVETYSIISKTISRKLYN